MNFQITRIRLASVGPEPARYDPLELDFRKPDQTGPADTVLFLPNTGGKTVLMRLLFSVLHPPIVERIGTEETAHHKKNLLGYVLDRDTAHVVIEWRRVEEGRFADEEVLLTGLAAEWRDGRRPADPKPEDLKRLWYSVRGPVRVVGVDNLIFEVDVAADGGTVRRRLPLRRFQEQLEELKKTGVRTKLEVSTTNVQRDWVEHLDRLGLDRALFRYQGEMNHNEAGASAIARFKEDRDFIKFFLEAVFDPAELAGLDHEFDEVADKVRRFPEYERRLRFEQAALEELEPLVGLVTALATAHAEAQTARTAAANLLAAFSGAEEIARAREQRERQRSREQDAEVRRLTTEADRFRAEEREFRRLGAALWKNDAKRAYESAAKRTALAELDVRAWLLTEDLARLSEARAKLKALDEAYQAEMERLRPLQTARDEAATRLDRRLAARAVLAAREAFTAKIRVEEARKRAATKRKEEKDAYIEAAKLDAAREANEKRVDEVAAFRSRLVTKGLLPNGERADESRQRQATLAADSLARIDVLDKESASLDAERERLDDEDRAAAPLIAEISETHARLAGDVERAENERKALSAQPLVIELAESTEFDLELVGSGIAERLLGRAREADDARLGIELRGIDDKRAVRGLEDTGFLPPPPEVEVALERLVAAGIVGALPGTRYIAEAISREHRGTVLANRADLVGGIVLLEGADLSKARAVLESASLDPTMIIAVGAAADLVAAERESCHRITIVVPPSEAVWDRTAGGAERARREARLAALDTQRIDLDRRAAGARRLADALVRHATAYPPGWLALRTAGRDAQATELARLKKARTRREGRRTEIAAALTAFRTETAHLRKIAREAEQRAAELQRLCEDEASIAGLEVTIERQRAEAKQWRGIAEEREGAAGAADDEANRESIAAEGYRAAAERIRQERSKIVLVEPIAEPSLQEAAQIAAGPDLFELRAQFEELDRRLEGETSASDVAAQRTAAIQARDKLAEAIEMHAENVRNRAVELLASPEAGELAGRRSAAERAEVEAASAHAAERETYAEHEKANAELTAVEDEVQKSRRRAEIPADRAPRDRHHAALLAADARQNSENAQGQIGTAERERNNARDKADGANKLADGLGLLATPLRLGLKLEEDAALPSVPPFDGDLEHANSTGRSTARRLTSAIDFERDAEQAWRQRDSTVRVLLAREEFADLAASDRLYRRLAQSPAEALARDADELVGELRAGIGVLQAELATLEEDRKLATTSLAKSVHKALSYLRLAETRSKLPARLRDWSGESFIEIRFDKPPAEELDVRLRTFVVQVLDPKVDRPTGSTLLMLSLDRAVGEFRVKILKPNEAFAPIRVPVAELSSPTFSNGQRATVATAMMLMLSELRRQSRSSARDASVGTLLLDNPLGNANAGFLIEVQRTVAAAAGIQLIYTTGIADHNALRRFSSVIALSNDAARRTMRRYVRANPALLDLLVPPEDEAGGRISARRVVAVTDHEASNT
ncbi:MAG: hypothetical protein JO121_22420 [Deltaproteobacteria bacterium]|nr:hypothetical protein [Deltaproteobacteria bacterium]